MTWITPRMAVVAVPIANAVFFTLVLFAMRSITRSDPTTGGIVATYVFLWWIVCVLIASVIFVVRSFIDGEQWKKPLRYLAGFQTILIVACFLSIGQIMRWCE